jgi:carbon storage regulator
MLVLSRKKNESVFIGDVTVTVVEIRGDRVRLGIVAPKEVPVHRQEICDAIHGRSFEVPSLPPAEEVVSEMIIVEAKLEQGGKIRFTSEGGFCVE